MTDIRETNPLIELRPVETQPSSSEGAVTLRDIRRAADLPLPTASVRPPRVIRWSFILLVLLPTFMSGIYLYILASDQYVAEARFAVRPADPIGGSDIAGASDDKSKGSATASYLTGNDDLGGADAEIVANYIHSRAIVDDVSRTLDIGAIFRRPEADYASRLAKDASAEARLAYWNKMVSVYIEASSGIVTLSVSAFRRDDAFALAGAILKSSNTLVNSLSRKVRADAMRTAEDEVRRSDGEVRFAMASLTTFRNANHLIDPVQSSEATGKLLLQLMSDKIETEAQLYVTQRTRGPDAPGIDSIRARLDSIAHHVTELQDQMAGDKQVSKNLAATLSQFADLELKTQFAERMYAFARDGVERARVAAIRQTVYLAVFVPPSLPQDATFPLRTTDFLLFGFACLMVWVCGLTITASILDHRI